MFFDGKDKFFAEVQEELEKEIEAEEISKNQVERKLNEVMKQFSPKRRKMKACFMERKVGFLDKSSFTQKADASPNIDKWLKADELLKQEFSRQKTETEEKYDTAKMKAEAKQAELKSRYEAAKEAFQEKAKEGA